MSHDHDDRSAVPERLWQSRPVQWSALSGLLLVTGFVADAFDAPGAVVTGLFIASVAAGARFFAAEAFEELVSEFEIDIELLMTVAAVVAGLLGLWAEAASLAFLYSISEALEAFTEDRTRHAIRALLDLAPRRVTRLDVDGGETEIDIADLRVGERFLVRPGQNVATDGTVEDGTSAVDEAAVTGESIPVEKQPGSLVFAGTTNAQGALVVRATATVEDNTLAAIVRLVETAQAQRGRGEQFMHRFARIYSPSVLGLGVLVAVVGGMATGDWSRWLERAATVIVAASPCALVIAIPVTYVAALGRAARQGVLIKGGIHLETLGRLRAIALDKTGTLTTGTPAVNSVHPLDGLDVTEVLRIAAAVEMRSEHPLARAIVQAAHAAGINGVSADDFLAITGAGATGTVDGIRYTVANPAHTAANAGRTDGLDALVDAGWATGATVVVLSNEHRPLGVIAIEDTVRANAADAIAQLRRAGIEHVVMLTGDNRRTAETIAASVGITEIAADLKPADKARIVSELVTRHGTVAMVGDGVNDAPSLAAASVGIAMGTAGSDVAIETADVALMADDLAKLATAIHIGHITRRVVHQNLALAFLILAVLIPGALTGLLTLPAAVAIHETSELVVILNGMRVRRTRLP